MLGVGASYIRDLTVVFMGQWTYWLSINRKRRQPWFIPVQHYHHRHNDWWRTTVLQHVRIGEDTIGECTVLQITGLCLSALSWPPTDFTHKPVATPSPPPYPLGANPVSLPPPILGPGFLLTHPSFILSRPFLTSLAPLQSCLLNLLLESFTRSLALRSNER